MNNSYLSQVTESFQNLFLQNIVDYALSGGTLTLLILLVAILLFWQVFSLAHLLMVGSKNQRQEMVASFKAKLALLQEEQVGVSATVNKIQHWLMHSYQSLYSELFSSHLKRLSLIVMLCPLLGLLGTVIGMVNIFDSLSNWGMSKPDVLASAISKAILPTLSGMAVAAVGLFLHYIIKRWVALRSRQIQILLRQSVPVAMNEIGK